MFKKLSLAFGLSLVYSLSLPAHATIVQFQTSLGNIDVNLYDETTPETVANFLAYVNDGRYEDVVFHRLSLDFVLQGGGFTFNGSLPMDRVPQDATVANEPVLSNVRGTIAMAKIGGLPDSATSQWFFNLVDNDETLDNNNGGFTVFGEVMGDGMSVVDEIAGLQIFDRDAPVSELPLRNYTTQNDIDNVAIGEDNIVFIHAIVVNDDAVDTAAGTNPPVNTIVGQVAAPVTSDGDSGGAAAIDLPLMALLLSLVTLAFRGRTKKA
jgi:peptidyl-prolyl cis-trans isomerase A (cyclophilin A)